MKAPTFTQAVTGFGAFASVGTLVFHTDFSGYVQAAALAVTLGGGVVAAVENVAITKHLEAPRSVADVAADVKILLGDTADIKGITAQVATDITSVKAALPVEKIASSK